LSKNLAVDEQGQQATIAVEGCCGGEILAKPRHRRLCSEWDTDCIARTTDQICVPILDGQMRQALTRAKSVALPREQRQGDDVFPIELVILSAPVKRHLIA